MDQIEKLADVLFFLIDQISGEDLELLRNGNFLSKLSSKLGETPETYTQASEEEEDVENYENFDLNNLKVDHESEDEDLEEDLDDEAEEERQMSESDLSEDLKDKDYEPKSELSETPVRIKIKKEKKPSSDNCMICNEDVDDLEKHDVDHHMEAGIFKCKDGCDFTSEEKKSLVEHFAVVHKEIDVFKCQDCGEIFFTMGPLADHLRKHHGLDIPHKTCPICLNTFPTLSQYRNHANNEHRTARKCNECDKYFKCKGALNAHVRIVHERPDFTCNICGETRKSKAGFEDHLLKHKNEEETVKCPECEKYFHTTYKMKQHLRAIHKKDKMLCSQCDYSCAEKSNLKRHIQTVHGYERNFICGICGAAFKTKHTLTGHEHSIHTNQRNFECEVCGKKFKKPFHLKVHRRIHTGDYEASCEKCGKQFVQLYNYKLHQMKCHARS